MREPCARAEAFAAASKIGAVSMICQRCLYEVETKIYTDIAYMLYAEVLAFDRLDLLGRLAPNSDSESSRECQ